MRVNERYLREVERKTFSKSVKSICVQQRQEGMCHGLEFSDKLMTLQSRPLLLFVEKGNNGR